MGINIIKIYFSILCLFFLSCTKYNGKDSNTLENKAQITQNYDLIINNDEMYHNDSLLTEKLQSQQDNDIIVWQDHGQFDVNYGISFSVNLPKNWIAMENTNPLKPICLYFDYNEDIHIRPTMFIAIHFLDESTDESLFSFSEFIMNISKEYYDPSEFKNSYLIIENNIIYEQNIKDIEYSRTVFFRYKKFCFQIALLTRYEKADDELIIVLKNLVNSIIIFEDNKV